MGHRMSKAIRMIFGIILALLAAPTRCAASLCLAETALRNIEAVLDRSLKVRYSPPASQRLAAHQRAEPNKSDSGYFFQSAHVRSQRFGNDHGAVSLLIVLQNRDPRAADGQARTV
jgi:hypothetical protein